MSKPVPITDELKQQVIETYKEDISAYPEEERPKVTMEIVNSIATEFGLTPNSARVILTNAGVYVLKKVEPKAASASAGAGCYRTGLRRHLRQQHSGSDRRCLATAPSPCRLSIRCPVPWPDSAGRSCDE